MTGALRTLKEKTADTSTTTRKTCPRGWTAPVIITTGGFVRRVFNVRGPLWALHPKVKPNMVIFCYRKIN